MPYYATRAPQKNEKTSQNQALQQKYLQKNKNLGSLPCKIFWTILEINGGAKNNGPKDKKIDD